MFRLTLSQRETLLQIPKKVAHALKNIFITLKFDESDLVAFSNNAVNLLPIAIKKIIFLGMRLSTKLMF